MIKHEKIEHIMELSKKLGNDSNKLISMMQEHTFEIKDLFDKKDKHFAVETGDLIMLAMQLLMVEGYDINEVMNRCYERFDKKFGVVNNGTGMA